MPDDKLLLLGGSHSEIPLIEAAKRLGFFVVTTGNRPQDLGHTYSDEYIYGDFSNVSEMTTLASEIGASAVCSGCNDFAAISAAAVAEELGLPGHDSAELTRRIHQKNEFYQMARDAQLPIPPFFEANSRSKLFSLAEELGFPVIVKPVDLTGGKGVSVATTSVELANSWIAAQKTSRQPRVVIQKIVEGTNHAISVLIQDRKIVFAFIDNEHYYNNPYLVGAASYPSILSDNTKERVEESVSRFLTHHSLVDGLLHLQFIVDKFNEYFFIDVCRRAPGDLYVRLVELSTGIPYPELIVRAEAGLPMGQDSFNLRSEKMMGRMCLMTDRNGQYVATEELSGPGTVIEKLQLISPGTVIDDVLTQKIEIIHMEFAAVGEMMSVMNTPSKRFHIQLK